MLLMFLILGGCVGVLYFVGCVSMRNHGMTFEEWEYKQNNRSSTRDRVEDWYRYLQEDNMFRPQILLSIIILGLVSMYSLQLGQMAITTGCSTLLGALGMKILESDK